MQISSYHPFRSEIAKTNYLEYYKRKVNLWPVNHEDIQVGTSYGITNVRISGKKENLPILLLPGYYSNSLLWENSIAALSAEYCTYAVDSIYDIGLSIYTRKPKSPNDYVLWLDELVTKLDLSERINIMGISFGGWLAVMYAISHPDRIAKLVLLAPASIVPLCIAFYFRGGIGKLNKHLFQSFFFWLFEDARNSENEITRTETKKAVEEILFGMECYQNKYELPPRVLTDSELASIPIPTLLMIGENEKAFSAKKVINRITRVAPEINTCLIPKAGHDLLLSQTEKVNEEVLLFLNRKKPITAQPAR